MPVTPLSFVAAVALSWAQPAASPLPQHPSCVAPDAVRERIVQIRHDDCRPEAPCWEEVAEELRKLRLAHPESVIVHRAYQDHVRRTDREALREEYGRLLETRPADASLHYLYSRLFDFDDTMREHAQKAYELDPTHPLASYALVVLEMQQSDRDEAKALRHLQIFLEGCPDAAFEALAQAGRVGDNAFWGPWLDRIGARLETSPDLARLESTPLLWGARFRLASPGEHAALRERLGAELAALEARPLEGERLYWRALQQGYEMLGDEDKRARVAARLQALDPCGFDTAKARAEAFEEKHGLEPMTAELDPEQARELLASSEEWLRACPDNLFYSMGRFEAVRNSTDLDAEQVRAEVERYLATWEGNKSQASMSQSPYYQVARLLLDRELDLHLVPGLIARERDLVEKAAAETLPPTLPEDMRRRIEASRALQRAGLDALAAEAHLALGDPKNADQELDELNERLAGLEEQDEAGLGNSVQALRFGHDLLRASLHHPEGREAASRAALRSAARLLPAAESRRSERDRFTAVAAEIGVDAESLLADAGKRDGALEAAPTGWDESAVPMPDFELVDLAGKTWRRADLLGKTTLVNFWATWCGPCIAELPAVQELHDRVAGSPDLQVLAFDVDRNPGLVQPFATKHGLTIPVLFAADVVEEWWQGAISIPRTWIVDPQGMVRHKQMGFDSTERATWAADALERMKALASRN